MDSNLLQERMDAKKAMEDAKKAMDKAQEKYDEVEEAFTEEWKTKNPSGSKAELFRYLKEELKDWEIKLKGYSAAVENKEEIYKKLVETYQKTMEWFTQQQSYTAELSGIKDTLNYLKRVADGEESSGSRTRSSGRKNTPFRSRLIQRNEYCIITGSHTFEAAHIIPHSFAKDFHSEWMKYYQPFCADHDHEVDDVRNGLLLSPTLHAQFDRYLFTVVYDNNKYFVKKSRYFIIPELEEKEIQFKGNPLLFPSPEFLAFHNGQFEEKVLKARADIESFSSPDNRNTINHHFETLDERKKKWIESQRDFQEDPSWSVTK
jgi:hypothetical protein